MWFVVPPVHYRINNRTVGLLNTKRNTTSQYDLSLVGEQGFILV